MKSFKKYIYYSIHVKQKLLKKAKEKYYLIQGYKYTLQPSH